MEVSAEVHFAQTLASNEKKFRDRALKRLRKYIGVRSSHGEGLSHEDFIKIWKGLHYCMWMQDKPLIQEELSDKMGDLLHAFPQVQDALKFVNVFFITEAREWTGIDRLRLDKFMMLIRNILHETFVLLSREGWPVAACESFAKYLTANIMNEDNEKIPFGLKSHITEIYMTEMRKVPLAGINGKKLTILMLPFIYYLLKAKRRELALAVFEKTIQHVLNTFGVWRRTGRNRRNKKRKGMPVKKMKKIAVSEEEEDDAGEESVDEEEDETESDMEEEEDDDDEEEEEEDEEDMSVDEVEPAKKPKYKFDLSVMIRLILELAQDPKVGSQNRSLIYSIVKSYSGQDPPVLELNGSSENVTDANNDANDDEDDENGDVDMSMVYQLIGTTEQKEIGKKKNRRRRKREGEQEEEKREINNNMSTESSIDLNSLTKKSETEQVVPNKRKNKKRKRISSDGEGVTFSSNVKKLKINNASSENAASQKTLNETSVNEKLGLVTKPSSDETASPHLDRNTNANSQRKKKKDSLSSAIEFVIYPQKSPKPKKITQVAMTSSLVSPIDDSSPSHASKTSSKKKCASESHFNTPGTSETDESSCETKTKPQSKKGEKNSKKKSCSAEAVVGDGKRLENGGTNLMESFYNVMTTPCNLVKKAVGMIGAPSTDPGPSREINCATPEQPLTPNSQKKVVFDLRRNKANKFKDYLKTLAKDPSPPFEPTKSPSQGILKSPSSTVTCQVSSKSPKTKKRRKSVSPRLTSSAKLKIPKSIKSLSQANKIKRLSASPILLM